MHNIKMILLVVLKPCYFLLKKHLAHLGNEKTKLSKLWKWRKNAQS